MLPSITRRTGPYPRDPDEQEIHLCPERGELLADEAVGDAPVNVRQLVHVLARFAQHQVGGPVRDARNEGRGVFAHHRDDLHRADRGPAGDGDLTSERERSLTLARAVVGNTHTPHRGIAGRIAGCCDRDRARRAVQGRAGVVPEHRPPCARPAAGADGDQVRVELLGEHVQPAAGTGGGYAEQLRVDVGPLALPCEHPARGPAGLACRLLAVAVGRDMGEREPGARAHELRGQGDRISPTRARPSTPTRMFMNIAGPPSIAVLGAR